MTGEIDGGGWGREHAIIVREETPTGKDTRTRYEPRSDGAFDAITETWEGDYWRPTGERVVEHLAIETPGER